jgi:hypothetical protein
MVLEWSVVSAYGTGREQWRLAQFRGLAGTFGLPARCMVLLPSAAEGPPTSQIDVGVEDVS